MNEIEAICGETLEYVDCVNVAQAMGLPLAEIILVCACALLGVALSIGDRVSNNQDAGMIVAGAFEGLLYGGAAAYFGSAGALLLTELAGPLVMSIALLAFGAIALAGIVLGLWHGDGGAGRKAAGVIVMLLWGALFIAPAIHGFTVDSAAQYETFLNLTALGLGAVVGLNGVLIATFGAMHPALGWLIVPWTSFVGTVGVLLGVLMHFGSWLFYDKGGDRDDTYRHNGLGMVVYKNGFRVKGGYAFSLGGVVNAGSNQMVWHEAVHVFQHTIFGSFYPITYLLWAAVAGAVGFVVGLFSTNVGHGMFALGYLNNPWEVWEYSSSWFGTTSNPRQNGTGPDAKALVLDDVPAWIVTVAFIAVALGGWVLWIVLRL